MLLSVHHREPCRHGVEVLLLGRSSGTWHLTPEEGRQARQRAQGAQRPWNKADVSEERAANKKGVLWKAASQGDLPIKSELGRSQGVLTPRPTVP